MTSLKKPGGRLTFLLAVGALWACDIPTATPILEQEWIFRVTETSVGIAELLPNDVALTEDSSAFTVSVAPISFQQNLGELCGACAGLDGLTVPKPAFQEEFLESIDLPEDVESAEVREGLVVMQARNGFGFDPLRPPGGQTGTITLVLHDGGVGGPVLDQVVINGDDTSFGPNATISRDLEYSGPVGSTLTISVAVNSPAGGNDPGNWVLIDLEDEVQVIATPELIEATSANISLAGESFDLGVTELDVGNVSASIVNRIQSGSIHFEIVNPWAVGAILNLTISGPTLLEPISLIAQMPASPTSSVEVQLSQADLQAFLGEPNVVISGLGNIDQGTGTTTLSPQQILTIDTRFDLVLEIG